LLENATNERKMEAVRPEKKRGAVPFAVAHATPSQNPSEK